jgi:hypothetical protein
MTWHHLLKRYQGGFGIGITRRNSDYWNLHWQLGPYHYYWHWWTTP